MARREKKFNSKDWKGYVVCNKHHIHRTLQEISDEEKRQKEFKICDGLSLSRENETRNINVLGDFRYDVKSICRFLTEKYGPVVEDPVSLEKTKIVINESDLGRYLVSSIYYPSVLKKIIDILDESGQGWFSKRGE